MKDKISYEFLSLEQELQRIANTQKQLVNDGEVLDLGSSIFLLSDYQRTKKINDLHDKLQLWKDASPLIRNVSVYIPSSDRIVTTGTVTDMAANQVAMKQIAAAIYKGGYPITQWNNRMYLSMTFPNRQSARDIANRPPLFINNIELSTEALQQMLSRISQEGGAALYGKSWAVGNKRDQSLLAEIRTKLGDREIRGTPDSSVAVGGQRYFVFSEKSESMDLELLTYIPEKALLGTLQSYRIWFWLLVACSLVIILLFSYGIHLLIQRPLSMLVRLLRNVEEGNFHIVKKQNRKDEFGYLFSQFERTVRKLKQSIDELYVQKIRLQQTELKQLQAQIAPHFLYNSFFILHQLIVSYDNEKAESVSKNLGEYFQYITRNSMDEVALEAEVNHVRSYLEIQNIRFSNRISASFTSLPDKFRTILVPRLVLQPIIENAYQHGLRDVLSGGRLVIDFLDRGDELCIVVEDNGSGMPGDERANLQQKLSAEEVTGESTGLINVHRRLKIKFGNKGGIEVQTGPGGGFVVSVHIPCEENSDVPTADR
ncbi:sensor histidine kinase [Cohnella nanjingensis]|nr:histidine kinase [Cohnella nanjingensis]